MNVTKNKKPLDDFSYIVKFARHWFALGMADIKLKYKRSFLGPLWIVLGTAITIGLMAALWTTIFEMEWRKYLLYIVIGILFWQYISSIILQSSELFTQEFKLHIHSQPTAPIFLVFQFVARVTVMFLHNMAIIVFTFVVVGHMPTLTNLALFLFGFAILFINAACISVMNSFLCARMQDFALLIAAVMSPMMLLTPVIWSADMLGSRGAIANLNPFTHFLDIVRRPLMNDPYTDLTLVVVLGITAFNLIVATQTYRKYRDTLVFWL